MTRFRATCDLVKRELKVLAGRYAQRNKADDDADDSMALASGIREELDACNNALKTLEKLLTEAQRKRGNLITQAVRTLHSSA